MSTIVLEYFETLFTSSSPSEAVIGRVLETVERKVDDQMNQLLCARFTDIEIRRALFDIYPDKAPGPDGLSTLLYQKFWDVVVTNVTRQCSECSMREPLLRHGMTPFSLSHLN